MNANYSLLHVHPRLPTNGTFEWINPHKYRNPTITSKSVRFRLNHVMFIFVDTTNVVTNINDEEVTIPHESYTIGEIIVMLNPMTETTFSISTKASSNGCIWIQSSYSNQFTNTPDFREDLGLEGRTVILPLLIGSNVINIARNLPVIQVYSSLVVSSDLQTDNQNNNLLTSLIIDNPTTDDCRSVEGIRIIMITQFGRLMFLKGFERVQTSHVS